MANDEKLFKGITWNETEIGIAKKNQKMKAKGIGTIETENCILNNVLFVPELSKNLLSVKSGGMVLVSDKLAEIKKNNKKFTAFKTEQDLWLVDLGRRQTDY